MASITLTIPNGAQTTRVLDALTTIHGYTGFEADGVTPQSKADFVKLVLIRYVKHEIKAYESAIAAEAARIASIDDVENNLTLT
jgi:hypothetical protein